MTLSVLLMEGRKVAFTSWLEHYGALAGLGSPQSNADSALKAFFRRICFVLHPDKHRTTPKHQARREYVMKEVTELNNKFWDTDERPESSSRNRLSGSHVG